MREHVYDFHKLRDHPKSSIQIFWAIFGSNNRFRNVDFGDIREVLLIGT